MEYESKKRARAVYRQKHDIVRVVLDMPSFTRDELRAAADASGLSLTAYILRCCLVDDLAPGSSAAAAGSSASAGSSGR